jgi:hypothetical protein
MNMLIQRGLVSLESFEDAVTTTHYTDLDLTVPASGDVTHGFKKIAHVIRPGHTFTVTLRRAHNGPGTKSHIVGYCSTAAGQINSQGKPKLEVVSITTGGTVNTNPEAGKYPDDTTEITFKLHLEEKEMILIGIIVEVFRPVDGTKQYLCDPQVGNGPP